MIERYLNIYSLALLGVALTLFVCVYAPAPMVCGLRPNIRLPWAANAPELAGSPDDLQIFVKKDRAVFIGPIIVPAKQLGSELASIASKTGTQRNVVISADSSVPFSLVQNVLAASRDAGFNQLFLVTYRGPRIEAWSNARSNYATATSF
jgi:biopolymer transport protein ExbD